MGKTKLKGKDRRDRYYHLAKETGLRARSAFKLVELNKKFNFLQESKVLVDLCAAPGGWLQIAAQNMPMQSIILGVDLCPIKPINGVQTFQDDITSESCQVKLRDGLNGWKVDCFLNDGAPNVGKNWLHDAYSQSILTLQALKLACTFLRKGGWFVTKVFRSKDYQSLLWVFQQLFHKVHSTKPKSSRNVSAEIFVVCQKFKYDQIKKIDKRFFDPRSVFEEVEERQTHIGINDFEPKKSKAKGYSDEFKALQYQENTVSDLLATSQPLTLLKSATKIVCTAEEQRDYGLSNDLIESLKDVKQCGKREVRLIVKWHEKNRPKYEKKNQVEAEEVELDEEEEEKDSDEEMQEIVDKMQEEEERALKKKAKATRKAKLKIKAREANLKHSGLLEDSTELFDLHGVKSKSKLEEIDTAAMDQEHKSSDEEDSDDSEYDADYNSDTDDDEEEEEENPLLVKEKKASVSDKWFQDEKFDGVEDIEDDIKQAVSYYVQKEKAQLAKARDEQSDEENEKESTVAGVKRPVNYASGSDSDFEVEELEQSGEPLTKKQKLSAQELALGTAIATSKKGREAIIDDSFNRYTFNDASLELPDWFVVDEKKRIVRTNLNQHITKEDIAMYKKREGNINDRTIKKVVEAKFRKRYHHMKKVEKVNKQASAITDSTEMSNKEKAAQLKTLYKKSGLTKEKEHTTYVFARKGMGQRVRRPNGVSGKFKVVDKRMKKEMRAMKRKGKK